MTPATPATAPVASIPGAAEIPLAVTEAGLAKREFQDTFKQVKLAVMCHMNAFAASQTNPDQALGVVKATYEMVNYLERDEVASYHEALRQREIARRLAAPQLSRPAR